METKKSKLIIAVLLIVSLFGFVACDKSGDSSTEVTLDLGSGNSGSNDSSEDIDIFEQDNDQYIQDAREFAGKEESNKGTYKVDEAELPPVDSKENFINWMVENRGRDAGLLDQAWERCMAARDRGDMIDPNVVYAFLNTPREEFARPFNRGAAYADSALPIGYGQTISGPYIVSHMTSYLQVKPEHKVLEIGTGSGYQSAVLSHLSEHVYTIEIVEELAEESHAIYERLEEQFTNYANITYKVGDGYYGWEEFAPFDRIIVTCGIDHIPPELLKQLKPGGIMVIPVGPPSGQTILAITKNVDADGNVSLDREDIYQGRVKDIFVPFSDKGGEKHNENEY